MTETTQRADGAAVCPCCGQSLPVNPPEPTKLVDEPWQRMFASGSGLPGNSAHILSRTVWQTPCRQSMPSGKPHYGRTCQRQIQIREVIWQYGDGSEDRCFERLGCGLCPPGVNAFRDDVDSDWEAMDVC